jgi:hypothetical protein
MAARRSLSKILPAVQSRPSRLRDFSFRPELNFYEIMPPRYRDDTKTSAHVGRKSEASSAIFTGIPHAGCHVGNIWRNTRLPERVRGDKRALRECIDIFARG